MSVARRFTSSSLLAGALLIAACTDGTLDIAKPVTRSIRVTPGTRSLIVGQQFPFSAEALDDAGHYVPGRTFTWTSSNNGVATVSQSGTVTAAAPGQATINATVDGRTAWAIVTVSFVPVARLEVFPATLTLNEGQASYLSATPRDANERELEGRVVTWLSTDPAIADVDDHGNVIAKKSGVINIVATSEGRATLIPVTVRTAVASIQAGPTAMLLEIGQSRQLTAITRDAAGNILTGRVVTWTTDSPQVAVVSDGGLLTARGAGYVTIFASSEGKSAAIAATVEVDDVAYDLVYHREALNGDAEIFILNTATNADPFRLNAGVVSRHPTPSANGQRIAFHVSMTDLGTQVRVDDLFAVDRNGMNMKRLTTADGTDDMPAWSPNGNRIAYRHMEPRTTQASIWVMNADGTGHTNLTADLDDGITVGSPAWSPDGQFIAYWTSRNGVAGTTQGISIMRADGSDKKMLTSTLTGFDHSPTWSHDGRSVAFIRSYGGDSDVTIANVATGALTRLPLTGTQTTPAWAPDGKLIAFVQPYPGASRPAIYTMRADGTDVRLRTNNPAWGGGSSPAWITRPQ